MADVTSNDVTLLDSWTEGGMANKRRAVLQVEVNLDNAGSGALGRKIPASAFGLKKVEEVSPFVNDDNESIILASPNWNGEEILLRGVGMNEPYYYSGLFRTTIKGQLKSAY